MMSAMGIFCRLWPQRLVRIGVTVLTILGVSPTLGDPGISGRSQNPEPLPEVSAVIQKIVDRAKLVARRNAAQNYRYDLRAVTEEFDAQGQVTKRTEKAYDVSLISGYPFPRLVKINGKNLSSEQLAKEDQREQELQKKVTSMDTQDLADRKESWITPDLMNRFEFVLQEKSVIEGRPVLKLDFKPKGSGLVENTLTDRLLNNFRGSIWVDESEFETAKLSAHLMAPVTVGWLGLLGALHQCEISLERTRMPDGVWINAKQLTLINGRKLFSAVNLRSLEESRNFSPQPTTAALDTAHQSSSSN